RRPVDLLDRTGHRLPYFAQWLHADPCGFSGSAQIGRAVGERWCRRAKCPLQLADTIRQFVHGVSERPSFACERRYTGGDITGGLVQARACTLATALQRGGRGLARVTQY